MEATENVVPATSEQVLANEEFQRNMAMAFGDPLPTPASADVNNPEIQTPDNPLTTGNGFDESQYLKQQFGVEDAASLKTQLEEYKILKETPPTTAEIKYANEESKKWDTYIREGKEDELYNSLHAKRQVKDVDSLTDDQKIKLYIKLNNPLFDQDLIDYQFDKDYKFNDAAYKDEDGTVTDAMGLRFAKVAAQQKMQNDITRANEYFAQYKTKIELPAITQQQNADKDYESYKASNAQAIESYNNVVAPSIKSLKETDVPLSIKVSDAQNQMNFEIGVIPEASDFEAAKAEALDYPGYASRAFYDDKGNFLAAKLQRAILLERNFDKYAQSIARQAVNAERKRVVDKETPGAGLKRDFNINTAPNEFQKEMDRAFAV